MFKRKIQGCKYLILFMFLRGKGRKRRAADPKLFKKVEISRRIIKAGN
jgi:hypothetical protein